MAVQYNYIVYSVSETLKQNFANRKIPSKQLLLFAQIAANQIMYQRWSKKPTNFYLNIFENIEVKQSGNDDNVIVNNPYIDAPTYFFNSEFDNGIDFIAYYTTPKMKLPFPRQTFTRSTLRQVVEMQNNPYSTAKASNPYFVLTNYLPDNTKRIYLFGISDYDVETIEMGLHSTVNPNVNASMADTLPIEDHEIALLIQMVYQAALTSFVTLTTREEKGKDVTTIIPPQVKAAEQAQQEQQQ